MHHPFNKGHKIEALRRFVNWQIMVRLNGWKFIYPLTKNTVIIAEKGMTGVTGSIYSGLLEFEDMMFVLHFLRPEDLFVDVGSNIGIYSILASGEIRSRTIAIEPVKRTFDTLSMNVRLNNAESRVSLLNIGIGATEGQLYFTRNEDTMNHVVSDDSVGSDSDIEKVEVNTLDAVCVDAKPILVKIDVEGYETNVIRGADAVLKSAELKGVIIELNNTSRRYDFNDDDIHEKLQSYGFQCYAYEPYERKLTPRDTYGRHNTIYLRDLDFVKARVQGARRISILHKEI